MPDASAKAKTPAAPSGSLPGHLAGLLLRPGGPWPASAVFTSHGLEICGVSASSLAERYGTPLLVVDAQEVRARARAATALFPRVLYAVKAFTSHAMIRLVLDEGLDLLAASGGEVEACLRAGAPASRIVLHGSNKSDAELDLAAEAGLSLVIVDDPSELARLDRAARHHDKVQGVLLRVLPSINVQTHEAMATGHEASKFGTPTEEILDAVRAATDMPGLSFEGLHVHLGSQVLDAEPYRRAVAVLLGLAVRLRDEAGISVRTLDIGGGFGVTYDDERALPMPEAASAVMAELTTGCARHELDIPTVVVEPGRSIVANSGITLYRVGAIKESAGRTLVAVDGGMSDNPRPMLYGARYAVAVASPRSDTATTAKEEESLGAEAAGSAPRHATIVGRHCESGDVLAEDVILPADLATGALLAFAATGAYTYSLASNYNRVGRPAVVAVANGTSGLWLRREDSSDLDRLETASHNEPRDLELPPGVLIRPGRSRDARSFLAFWRAVVEEGRYVRSEQVAHPLRVYRARFRQSWTDNDAQIVAVAGDRVIGHLYIQRERHPVTRHIATLGIAVAAEFRSRGVGSALLAEAFRWARGVGVEKIVLSVYPHNTSAIALYRRFGFVEEGRLARQSRKSYGYEDEILMACWLAQE